MADIDPKKVAAEKAVSFVENGMTLGLGTGSTAYWAIRLIGDRVKEGLAVTAVCTSAATEKLAQEFAIPVVAHSAIEHIDLAIDGADEVDTNHFLIKGGGGALLREKILAFNSTRYVVVVDETKLVQQLGKFPLPVEIVQFAVPLTIQHLQDLGATVTIRQKDGQNYITDNGNFIADCCFLAIPDPTALNQYLHQIPGVVETGIFLSTVVSEVLVGKKDGTVEMLTTV